MFNESASEAMESIILEDGCSKRIITQMKVCLDCTPRAIIRLRPPQSRDQKDHYYLKKTHKTPIHFIQKHFSPPLSDDAARVRCVEVDLRFFNLHQEQMIVLFWFFLDTIYIFYYYIYSFRQL